MTVSDLVRESAFGQIARLVTRNKVFLYPEERADFELPSGYPGGGDVVKHVPDSGGASKEDGEKSELPVTGTAVSTPGSSSVADVDVERQRTDALPHPDDRLPIEQQLALEKTTSRPIVPTTTTDGVILVDWYATDDPANPQNWSGRTKAFVALQIDLYTFVVYCGSSIYVSSQMGVMQEFGVGVPKASLGLALYVLGYGLGPLLWAPMSEIPTFGRNVPYVATFAVYVVLCVPTALADNLGGLLVLRFLQGFFGSPCLANGGASMQDMYSLLYLPYSLAFWVSAAFAAPALGPLLSGFSVVAKGWRWSLWEILWMSAPVFVLWLFFLPETSADSILLRRAARLRKLCANDQIRSQSEMSRAGLKFSAIVRDALIKPCEIAIKDPAVMFTNLYTAYIYGIYYSFFEVFPLVYSPLYGFNLGEASLIFLCIVVGCLLGMAIYFSYLHWFLLPDIRAHGMRAQEWRLRPALVAAFGIPVGLFVFGWTARADVHWLASCVGNTVFALSVYVLLQCVFVYVPLSYPRYAASLFAANDLFRSAFAFAAVLYARPMFVNLGIGRGVSLLGGLSVFGVVGVWLLYFYGASLRARSKFAV
ncbi:MAG: hypothetical protein M1832_005614 [Thelocarpon impressellum]|nr:MAG: hypothetical protein M1832_005614 [Thelocarpon impressellum]